MAHRRSGGEMTETIIDNAGKPARLSGRWPIKREVIGAPACPVMHRWTLARVRGRKLIVHHFLPDSEDMSVHDHPSPFWTLVLRGGYDDIGLCPACKGRGHIEAAYREWGCPIAGCVGGEIAGERMRAGMLRHRAALHSHRTRTLPTGAWTLVLMGRKQRAWGFWNRGRWWPWADHEKAFGMGMRCPEDHRVARPPAPRATEGPDVTGGAILFERPNPLLTDLYSERSMLDTNDITWPATDALLHLDASFIGTPDYMGVAYFWAYEYRRPMRGLSYADRRRVHHDLLAAGLVVDGESDAHEAIIGRSLSAAFDGLGRDSS